MWPKQTIALVEYIEIENVLKWRLEIPYWNSFDDFDDDDIISSLLTLSNKAAQRIAKHAGLTSVFGTSIDEVQFFLDNDIVMINTGLRQSYKLSDFVRN